MRRWIKGLTGVLFGLLPLSLMAAEAAPVRYAEHNIDWGEVAESETVRTRRPSTLALGGAPETLQTRVLTLASGSKVRITERIEQIAGKEARIFESGRQLSEITVIADESHLDEVLEMLRRGGYPVRNRYGRTGRILRVGVPQEERARVQALLADLATLGETQADYTSVNFYLPSGRLTPSPTPNDPLFDQQWGLRQVGVPQVWAKGFLGYPNIPCAVYDTGVRMSHEDLQVNVRNRVSALNSDKRPDDHHGHGSHCLGIMGADGNNGKGITGVGQVANLTSIRGPISYWKEGDSILDGYQYALDNGIKVLSCSFGTPPRKDSFVEADRAMIGELGKAGTLVVIAAGNDANDNDRLPTYPASYDCDNILAVAATGLDKDEKTDILADFSSYGATTCDIGAPGVAIMSCTNAADTAYEAWDGTSMATPLVAACAAMLWERNPSWTYADVKRRLMATAAPCEALLGRCQTGGRIDLVRALDASAGYLSVTPFAETAITAGTPITLTVTAEQVAAVAVTLTHRDGSPVAQSTFVPLNRAFPDGAPSLTFDVWTPEESDKGRGYVFRIEALNADGEPIPEVFAYSSLFRVKSAVTAETIAVTAPAGDVIDAGKLQFPICPSDAEMVDIALESRADDAAADAPWDLEATLGRVSVTPGAKRWLSVQLKGKGWISARRSYRLYVSDTDDAGIVGTSVPFRISRSSCSVYLMPGDPLYPDDPERTLGHSTDTWKSAYRAGKPFRLTGWLPESSMYWFALVDNDNGQVLRLTDYWASVKEYRGSLRRFEFALPDAYAVPGKRWRLAMIDIFSGGMIDASPKEGFEILPRVNSGGAEFEAPALHEVIGDHSGLTYRTDGRWRAAYRELPDRPDVWFMRCGWLGPGEQAVFDTQYEGPTQELSFTREWENRADGISFHLQYAVPPNLDNSWTDLNPTSAESIPGSFATRETYVIEGGSKILRWVCTRAFDAAVAKDEGAQMTLFDVAFSAQAAAITLHVGDDGMATVSNDEAYPTYVTYTEDGTDPTADSPRWTAGQRLFFPDSFHLKVRCFSPGKKPGRIAEHLRFAPALRAAGTESDPYLLTTAADMATFAEAINRGNSFSGKFLRLTQDIDLTGLPLMTAGWEKPFGMPDEIVSRPFSGTLDGDGHRLIRPTFLPFARIDPGSGIPQEYCVGFIGLLSKGTLRNLILYHPTSVVSAIGSYNAVASLVGINFCGTIDNCHVVGGTVERPAEWCHVSGLQAVNLFGGQYDPKRSTFEGTIGGTHTHEGSNLDLPQQATLSAPAVPVPAPVPGHFFEETLAVTAQAGADGGTVQYSESGPQGPFSDFPEEGLTLRRNTENALPTGVRWLRTLWFRTLLDDEASAAVKATYISMERPGIPAPMATTATGGPLHDYDLFEPLSAYCRLQMMNLPTGYPPPKIRYTVTFVDPSLLNSRDTEAIKRLAPDPDATSALYSAPFLIPGTCVIKARAFALPDYRPGDVFAVIQKADTSWDGYKADLRLIGGHKSNQAEYWSELFEITADTPPAGHFFSHWQVTGPLVLDDPKANPLTFRYLTKEPVTLKAIFLPVRPGYRLLLK